MNRFIKFLEISLTCFIVSLTIIYFAPTNSYFEFLSHFSFIYFIISVIFLIFSSFLKNKILIVCALITCMETAYPWASLLLPSHSSNPLAAGDDVSILQFNILYKNTEVSSLIDYVQHKNYPDIVLIQEATPDIIDKLQPLKTYYPHTFEASQWGAYGMIIFSKLPIIKAERKRFEHNHNHYTLLDFQTSQHKVPFTLIELHAISPLGDPRMNQRKQDLEEISKIIAQLPGHKILIGDLNTTPYSPYFTNLLNDSGLKNSMQGLRIQGTWPSNLPSFLHIPLDHFLISDRIHVVKQEICPSLGSDHMSVLTQVRLPR